MSEKIVCLVGPSGSGKSMLETELKNRGFKGLESYKTRSKRNEHDSGTFVTEEEFDAIRHDLVAYTYFAGYEYGATRKQIEENDIYVIDPDGVKELAQSIGRNNMYVVYLNVNRMNCFDRMVMDHNRTIKHAEERSMHDAKIFPHFSDYDMLLRNENMDDFFMNVEILQNVITHWCKK